MKQRAKQVRMLHICLGNNAWHWRDVWFVLTGRA